MTDLTRRGHSEEYFTEGRSHWYNPDFLDLMAKRWGLHRYANLLDIGSGLCHWSKLLVRYLQPGSEVVALDSDPKWSKGSAELTDYFEKAGSGIAFRKGTAYRLPFPDDSFDVVTCQTLLIHLKHPEKALMEMKRVVKPNGIVICSEPNNRIQSIIQDSSNHDDGIKRVLDRVKDSLVYEKNKLLREDGNNSFGDLLTGTMNRLGFTQLQSYLNDKLISIYPPYDTPEQQAAINMYLGWGLSEPERLEFERQYDRVLSGEEYSRFLAKWPADLVADDHILTALKNQTYTSSGAALLYLISGKK